jgi:hypothetical protein
MTAAQPRVAGVGVWRTSRSRGAVIGPLLVLLGAWGALVAFAGPYFAYGYTPLAPWVLTGSRLWLELLPGVATVIAGVAVIGTAHRAGGVMASWLAVASGAWFVVGTSLWTVIFGVSEPNGVAVGGPRQQALAEIGMFTGLGVVIVLLGAVAMGRFSVSGTRDGQAAPGPATIDTPPHAG